MSLKIANGANTQATIPVLLLAQFANQSTGGTSYKLSFVDAKEVSKGNAVELSDGEHTQSGEVAVVNQIAQGIKATSSQDEASEKKWLGRYQELAKANLKLLEPFLAELDNYLTFRSYIIGYALSAADIVVYGLLRGSKPAYAAIKKDAQVNVSRWFRFLEESNPWIVKAIQDFEGDIAKQKLAASKVGGNFEIGLPDTEKGVVTRFPPEPSGYLHIGHAKAALLNDYFAHERYKGTLLLRYDDTNPSNESAEFQDSILEDLDLLGIKPDKITHTSDYFQELYEYCIQMIKSGNAYADDTDQDTMRKQRMDGIPSVRRDRSVEENLKIFEEMKEGSPEGLKNCIRAKISFDNPNKAMRDPVIYRCNPTPHHRTGDTWKIYPTYDFCCPVVDSMEGVTHALRTIEYRDRNPQYQWMLDALKLRKVYVWDFSRLNLIRTLLSKRKLAKFVKDGIVTGWDDPRFPTVRGIRRRGMTVPALREFIIKQGPSKNVVNMDWTIIWATNKKYIDPVAPRFTALDKENLVTAKIRNGPEKPYSEERPKHPKNAEVGTKQVAYSNTIQFEQADAKTFKKDEEITLMGWGNAFVRSISYGLNPLSQTVASIELELHLEGDFKKTEKKVTWLSTQGPPLVDVELYEFDYLITKDKIEDNDNLDDFINKNTETRTPAVADANVALLKAGDIVQFERKGYFRMDSPAENGRPAVFFGIPTGRTK